VVLAILVAQRTHSLVALALCIAGTAVLGGLAQIPFTARRMPSLRRLKPRLDKGLLAELLRFSGSLAVWNFGMLLISGLDLTIVGHFQFAAVGYYAVAGSAIALMAGLNNSILGAFLAPQAALHARGEYARLAALLTRTTRINSLLNFFVVLIALLFAHPLLRFWVGETYAIRALPVLLILTIAQAVRFVGAPYCMMLISTGEQSKGIWSGVAEAITNLIASLWLGYSMGYVGVAWGTLIGAVAGIIALIVYTVPRTQQIPVSRWRLMESALLRPMLCLLPLTAYTLVLVHGTLSLKSAWLYASLLTSGLLIWIMEQV
jgi:O-antigen/teichoic acid export membrane protein